MTTRFKQCIVTLGYKKTPLKYWSKIEKPETPIKPHATDETNQIN